MKPLKKVRCSYPFLLDFLGGKGFNFLESVDIDELYSFYLTFFPEGITKVREEEEVGITKEDLTYLLKENKLIPSSSEEGNLALLNLLTSRYQVKYFLVGSEKEVRRPAFPVYAVPNFPCLYGLVETKLLGHKLFLSHENPTRATQRFCLPRTEKTLVLHDEDRGKLKEGQVLVCTSNGNATKVSLATFSEVLKEGEFRVGTEDLYVEFGEQVDQLKAVCEYLRRNHEGKKTNEDAKEVLKQLIHARTLNLARIYSGSKRVPKEEEVDLLVEAYGNKDNKALVDLLLRLQSSPSEFIPELNERRRIFLVKYYQVLDQLPKDLLGLVGEFLVPKFVQKTQIV